MKRIFCDSFKKDFTLFRNLNMCNCNSDECFIEIGGNMIPRRLTDGKFILLVCKGCQKVKRHSEWVVLTSQEIARISSRSHDVEGGECPDCLKIKELGEVYSAS